MSIDTGYASGVVTMAGPEFPWIMGTLERRRTERSSTLENMRLIRDAYNGDIIIPLPEMNRAERPAVANLIVTGIDQTAERIASVMPSVDFPPRRPGIQRSEELARTRTMAVRNWWDQNSMNQKMRRRARWFVGYSSAPVVIRPDFKRQIPCWEIRDPLSAYPAPTQDPDDICPPNAIFTYFRSTAWLCEQYPVQMATLMARQNNGNGRPLVAQQWELVEYVDAEVTVLGVIGPKAFGNQYATSMGNLSNGGTTYGGAPFLELERVPNPGGLCPAVVPARVTLDRPKGQFDDAVGMYESQARVMALEMIAIERGIFPDTYLISRPNETAQFISGPHDGRSGNVNVIKGGEIRDQNINASQAGNALLDRLERNVRVTSGTPAEYGGECCDATTEILTTNGWKSYSDVEIGTEVLTLNHDTGFAEWKPVEAVNVFRGPRQVLIADGPRHSSVSTLNHRWPVHARSTRTRRWVTSSELNSNHRIPIAAMNADLPTEAKYSDALVEAVAWYYTEGSTYPSGGQISQSVRSPANCERIRACLTVLFGPATTSWRNISGCGQGGVGHDGVPRWAEPAPSTQNGVIKFRLSRHAADILHEHAPGKVPSCAWLRTLTQAQLELFLRVSLLADNCGGPRFGQKDPRRSEAFAFAAILSGQAVSYQTRERTDARPEWPDHIANIVRVRERRWTNPKESAQRGTARFEVVEHDGPVWCPTVENSSWYARRGGTVYFTGNSQTNVRTGKRGDAIMAAVTSFPVQSAQETFAAALQEENRRAIAVMRSCFGKTKKSFYYSFRGVSQVVDYVPDEVFEVDFNKVTYAMAGSDANGLIVGIGQRIGIGMLSKRTGMELDPYCSDPEMEHDRVTAEAIEAAVMAGLQAQAQQGAIPISDLSRIAQLVVSNKQNVFDAIAQVQQEAQARQASSGQPGTPEAPVAPGSPEAQPGLAQPGAGAEAATIAPPPGGLANLSQYLQQLRSGGGQ